MGRGDLERRFSLMLHGIERQRETCCRSLAPRYTNLTDERWHDQDMILSEWRSLSYNVERMTHSSRERRETKQKEV